MGRETLSKTQVEELLGRARAGVEDALEELFTRCEPTISGWAARRLAGGRAGVARPSDIAQETALRAYRKFTTFSGSTEGEWFAWLLSVFRSRVAQSIRDARRQKREDAGTLPMDSPEAMAAPALQKSPSQATALDEEWRRLLAYIYQLPSDQRDAIWLCHLKELPVAEVAKQMEKTEAAVAGLLQRGLRALRGSMMTGSEAVLGDFPAVPDTVNAAAAALLTYLQRRDAGERLDPDAFVVAHPTCADELRAMLDWIERIQAIRPTSSGS